ncbi:MAG: FAD-binding oxidoreductase [Pseudomonadota bacterium]
MTGESSLWRHTVGSPSPVPSLSSDIAADVVVVGGGFTGCSAALHLADAGANVCVLEARTVGYGGSGRNVGLVNAGLWLPPDSVEEQLGKEIGSRLNNALAGAPAEVFALIERFGISCEATRHGTLHCAHSRRGLADLQRRHEQQRARQAPVDLLDADETASRTGTTRFHGALLDRRAGTIQPLGYVKGLARAATAAGARLFEGSPVTHVHHDGANWIAQTAGGRVTAKHLIQATNAYDTRNGQPATYTPVHYFQCATAPLGGEQGRHVLPGGEGCWDTDTVMSSFRRDTAGRLIIGAVGNLDSFGGEVHKDWARRKLRELYPELSHMDFEHAWYGRIAMTADHLPRVSRLGPNAVGIYGYSGRGIGPGTVFGKAAATWVSSGDESAFPLPIKDLHHERFSTVKALYYESGATLVHLAKARAAGRASTPTGDR